ncbi:PAAR-like domain-containing protein [Chitinibacter mangrovi]|uniref:PAAR-like domain-containing protein n=1 Tax=Chitinibacter mangrovi TaxID=3153927 RepID=UPI003D818D8C
MCPIWPTAPATEPATQAFRKGIRTGVITGKVYFVDWSSNVKFEGLNVCRHIDPVTHNHK